MTKNDKYFTFFTKFFIVLCFEQIVTTCVGQNHNKNSPKPINYGRVRGVCFIFMSFIHFVNKFTISCGEFNPSRSETAFYSVANGFYIRPSCTVKRNFAEFKCFNS